MMGSETAAVVEAWQREKCVCRVERATTER
jgi:hypothetical protein